MPYNRIQCFTKPHLWYLCIQIQWISLARANKYIPQGVSPNTTGTNITCKTFTQFILERIGKGCPLLIVGLVVINKLFPINLAHVCMIV